VNSNYYVLSDRSSQIDDDTTRTITDALQKLGLGSASDVRAITQLTGGVSSDIWRIDLSDRSICAKRALSRLKVSAVWEAPLSRNSYEYAWYQSVAPISPGVTPRMLGRDAEAGIFFMEFLETERYPVWKSLLLEGRVDLHVAEQVGSNLGRIHAQTASSAEIAARFKSDAEFFSLRLEPYLLATIDRHPALGDTLRAICNTTATTRLVLVHGDVSPKNILCGPSSPVFLDAECAWYGDPAFDLAFCLNHMLLKAVHLPTKMGEFLSAFEVLYQAYLAQVNWEQVASVEARTARLLPALFLARVDGKSPVEYLTQAAEKETVRRVALACLRAPPDRLGAVMQIAKGSIKL
jgi:aminoglycoside phosphotransferase (APT) family kinase protein